MMSEGQLKTLQDCCCLCNKIQEARHVLNPFLINLIKEVFNIQINAIFDKYICNECQSNALVIRSAKLANELRQAAIALYRSTEIVAGTSAATRDRDNRSMLRNRIIRSRSRSDSRSLSTPPTPGEGLASSDPSSYKESKTEDGTE
ncbi:hypothetical protein HA402_008014 [Bradysia odoriphaga]|nr:hypothetical protein HA402_008014 [Bradysia odoriphaga]